MPILNDPELIAVREAHLERMSDFIEVRLEGAKPPRIISYQEITHA